MKKWFVMSLIVSLFIVSACGGSNNGGKTENAANATNAPANTNNAAGNESEGAAESDEITPEEGASLLVWESKEERPFVEAISKEFTEKYGIEVKFEEVGAADQVTKLTTDGPAGLGADVVVFPHDNLGRAVTAGLVLPNDFYEEQAKTANSEIAVNAVSYGGTLYGYPRSIETYALFYNKALIKEAPKTFDEIVAFAKTYNDVPNNKFALMWEVGNFYFNYPFISTGGYVYGENGQNKDDIGLNTEGAVSGLKYYGSLKDSILPLNSGDITYDIKKGMFTGGTLAMDINGPWTIADYKSAGIDFGVAPIPSINGQPASSFSGVKAWYVNQFSKYPNAARLFANFASTKAAQLKDFELTGAIPANTEATNDAAVQGNDIVKGFVAQFNQSTPMPSIPEMGNVWSPIAAAFSDVWNSGKVAKAALDNAVQQIKDANNGTTAK
ncbi:arabinogalactan oligomer/maltooligosaccharide transport system substrate-binding protein [Paenibacillus endophyticus]|uniref:Maltodextrin-binding protein n=1 Tax=Paenibacillus endophyticus TaxID=1294268 RepID=A0A7W5CDG9_9BACL|nr:maltose ABC transporter substrate-binding protein [Paenibacillus endophyticus]MBB3155698.1 arabinogalactan oligomer/maltooligosaccharide transport system substrate-binding protein [Paenibacillus endophyticus]